MSASREADPLRKFSRGERRNAARVLAKDLKRPFREVWERAYRIQPEQSAGMSLFNKVARFVIRHIVTPTGKVVHPTKGWRGKDGLPLGRKVRAA